MDGSRAQRQVIIEVKDFTYRYPRTSTHVLKNINLKIHEGEFIGVVGPTGAGKTTLCLCLCGLIPHVLGGKSEGSVVIHGKDAKDTPLENLLFLSDEKKALVGITFQDPEAQLVGMTVEEDLAFGPENLGLPPEEIEDRVRHVLELIRMQDFRFTFPYKLSGGQKQRVAIGSTLALRPQVLILDEPTSELDPIGRGEVFSVIRELREQLALTIIMVEHHTEELARYCDRIILMNQGEIVIDDTPHDAFAQVEKMRSVGVRPPDGTELLAHLSSLGITGVPDGAVTEDEIVLYLATLLHEGR